MARKKPTRTGVTKMISGVQVHNYDKAFKQDRWDQSFLESMEGMLEADQEHWLVMLKKGVSEEQLLKLCSAHAECEVHGDASGVPFVELTASESQLGTILGQEADKIAYVEPNMPVFATPEVSATETEVPWGLRRIRARSLNSMPSSDPGPANGGNGVNVYVLDTGVRLSHNEFGGRAKAAIEVALMFFIKDCNGWLGGDECSLDDQGHGSHCAGTIAGANYGVAKGATIHSAKVLSASGAGNMIGIANAINWVANNHQKPAVASMSLGGGFIQSLNDAVNNLNAAGVTVVTASGNSDDNSCDYSPGSAVGAINVGSLDPSDSRSSFSNYGACLDIWAPGRDVLSSVHTADDASATYSGTSMACPHVSGAAAIILAAEPALTPDAVKQRLLEVATPDLVTDAQDASPNLMLYSDASTASLSQIHRKCWSGDYAIIDKWSSFQFAEMMADCGKKAVSWTIQWRKNVFDECAMGKTGLGQNCIDCYEFAGKYGFDNCKGSCWNKWCSSGCLGCSSGYNPTLEHCVGRPYVPVPSC